MAPENITSISLKDVRKLVADKNLGESVLDAVDKLLGLLLAFSPAVGGHAAIPLLSLVGQKNELVRLMRDGAKKLSKVPPGEAYLDQSQRMAAANCMLAHIAFFDAFHEVWPQLAAELQLENADAEKFLAEMLPLLTDEDNPVLQSIPLPLPTGLESGYEIRHAPWDYLFDQLARRIDGHLLETSPLTGFRNQGISIADRVYQADRLGLAIEYQQYFTWLALQHQDDTEQTLGAIGERLQTLDDNEQARFELIARALHGHDLGFRSLGTAVAHMPQAVVTAIDQSRVHEVAVGLHRTYRADVREKIIKDQFEVANGGRQLQFPAKLEAFIPQAYRAQIYRAKGNQHLERDDAWSDCEVRNDIGAFIVEHLESRQSVDTPLLLLGHPGSGKSLLTEMLAGQLSTTLGAALPRYATVRIKLRDIVPDKDLVTLLTEQLRIDTEGLDEISWARFANGLAEPPVVILDGYDELLQATGQVFASYLEQTVRQFQEGQARQHRPVKVIVTSRLTLIDKAHIPNGTTVVRLEEFSPEQCERWTEMWNRTNASHFAATGVHPFTLPTAPKLLELARQPLLLLMLALYDSEGNELSSRPDIDQTALYDSLLRRFVERELTKDEQGRTFREKSPAERTKAIDEEMCSLGVSAIGMFNRRDVKITGSQLNDDLHYFGAEQEISGDGRGRPLSQAEHVFGSFFFIHKSHSQLDNGDTVQGAGSTAFEFLHNTFGEFLTADFILNQAIEEAEKAQELSGRPRLADNFDRHLTQLSESWFGCLIHTPLFTRPVVLSMLREWGGHRISGDARPALLAALDAIVSAQLRVVLNDLVLPDPNSDQRAKSKYDRLSNRGHLAIYSLNLVLLRAYLGDDEYVLNEDDLADPTAGCRPWDSLVNLWRSWFPLEDLSVLAAWMTATRRENQITIEPSWNGWVPLAESRIYLAHSAGVALADDLTAALTGLHIASLEAGTMSQFDQIRGRIMSQVPELIPVADILSLKLFDGNHENLSEIDIFDHGGIPHEIDFYDALTRSSSSPQNRPRVRSWISDVVSLSELSRYQAESKIDSMMKLKSGWLETILETSNPRGENVNNSAWKSLLETPSAAPALRAALREFSLSRITYIASRIAISCEDSFNFYDIDTATTLALLFHRGKLDASEIEPVIGTIIQQCGPSGTWDVQDIPSQNWSEFASLLLSADPGITRLRREFTKILEIGVADSIQSIQDNIESAYSRITFLCSALRLGANRQAAIVVNGISQIIPTLNNQSFFNLIHWLHGENEFSLIESSMKEGLSYWLFSFLRKHPEEWNPSILHIPAFRASLTTQQADDLRWLMRVLLNNDSAES